MSRFANLKIGLERHVVVLVAVVWCQKSVFVNAASYHIMHGLPCG
jgi:hypothetical protein